MNTRLVFHYLSYLQYPLMLAALAYSFKPLVSGFDSMWSDYNNLLVFAGLGISLSTLQDTRKTQNTFSRKIWQNPRSGKVALIVLAMMTLMLILAGFIGLYLPVIKPIRELSLGLIVLGIGYIGLLKTALEMFENHRLDKKTVANQG
jgi:hypothetical protein